jgi:hypothetical protein
MSVLLLMIIMNVLQARDIKRRKIPEGGVFRKRRLD